MTGCIWVGVSGSSVSSREIETSKRHFAEPLIGRADTSWLSSNSRFLGFKFKRPTSYILLHQEREKDATRTLPDGKEEEDASMHYGVKRPMSDENGSSSDGEASGWHRSDTCPPPSNDNSYEDGLAPWTRGPDPRGRNGDSSDNDYKEDSVDPWALRRHLRGSHRRSPEGDGRKSERPSWLPDNPDEKLETCPICQTWAYGIHCCTLSSPSTGSSTGSSNMSRFRYEHLIKK